MIDNVSIEGLHPEPVLGHQVNAVLRVLVVLGPKKHEMTFEDVLGALAQAEEAAQLVCGFILLNENPVYIEKLKKYLITQEYIAVDSNGFISHGVSGLKRVNVPLPAQIEAQLAIM